MTRIAILLFAAALAAACTGGHAVPAADALDTPGTALTPGPPCAADNGGITLPRGFCATIFADSVNGVRHLVVAPNGDLFGAIEGRRGAGGGAVGLRDTDGDGRADQRRRFGSRTASGIALRDGWLYLAYNDAVVRWRLDGELAPQGEPQTLVSGLPSGGHSAKTVALDGEGAMYVNIGSRSNVCEAGSARPADPCEELPTRAGVWRFDAGRTGQTQAQGTRFATGVRNALALAVRSSDGALYAAVHGRDRLNAFPIYDDRKSAENPGEELVRLRPGSDLGWPYCFYDVDLRLKVLAPEYGGDGRATGRCARAQDPLIAFPGHWAPMALVFYETTAFPARYRGGAFLSFHGSWNRAPLPQAGYRVVFIPFAGARPGRYETFADGFAGPNPSPGSAHRPMGLAVAPDGALYIGDDSGGRIWRVTYRGE